MATERLQPLAPAFSRTARRMVLLLASFSIIAFAVGSKTLLHMERARYFVQQGELCAAAIGTSNPAEMPQRVGELQSRTDRVIAIAILNEQGSPERIYPDRPAHRELIEKLRHSPMAEMELASPSGEESEHVVAVPVRFYTGSSGASLPMLVVLRIDSDWKAWLPMMGSVTFAVLVIAFLRLRTLQRWFDEQIARPLGEMAGAMSDPSCRQRPEGTQLPSGRYRETARITATFQELLNALTESHSQGRKLRREAEHRIKNHEAGFDKQLRQVRDQATTDPLTGLRNRRFLDEQLDVLFDEHCASGKELCAVMIDVDNFKRYNDANGHQVGDALLTFVGALLRGSIRPSDHAVRYGGDEFLLLLPGTKIADAAAVTERLAKIFGQYVGRLDNSVGLSMSAGVAALKVEPCKNGHDLIDRADAALYSAKFNGKNGVACGPVSRDFRGRRAPSCKPEQDERRVSIHKIAPAS